MVNVAFVAPFFLRATLQFIDGAASLSGVRLALITQDHLEKVPPDLRAKLAYFDRIDNALDATQIQDAVRRAAQKLGPVTRLLGTLEDLQEILAEVRQTLNISGMGTTAATNFRQKSRMKEILRASGIPCARHCLATHAAEVNAFAEKIGFPLVAKPPAGAGTRHTTQINGRDELASYLARHEPTTAFPILFEEFVMGNEHTFESMWIRGHMVWHSLTRYFPSPLEVLKNPWIQWCILLPREIDHPHFDDIREIAAAANRALGIDTGLTHLEWFRRMDGSVAVSEVAARPPGGQLTSITGFAHDFDIHRAWARLMVFGELDPPKRAYAAGAAFIRAQGSGDRIEAIHGVDKIQEELEPLIVEMKMPQIGAPPSGTYEGEGYILLRHPITAVVEKALFHIITTIRVELG
ncbi:ATP-grasp domain-containing protein [Sulfidibacter corallicola]|uniref:ATP-grasp domain-containing protein n=1 Tax=Sulfidibacter corallicola TaxID=2818388 RepID=A0A8A4TS25_SULCO|nr:ATP-grasp domain-containing protein [Sulfidibacter corallicola]QTD52350.1 ATP-grasp domain-containing protein [Sulfidibacter corallicola]